MVGMILLTLFSAILAIVLVIRSAQPEQRILPALGAWGGVLSLASLFFLPWVDLAPASVLQKNAAWIASQTEVVRTIKTIPGLKDWLGGVNALTAEDVIQLLGDQVNPGFVELARQGFLLNGYRLALLASRHNPLLTLSIILGSVLVFILSVLQLRRLIASPSDWQGAGKVLVAILALCWLILATCMPGLDTLGDVENFSLRLLMALAETRVASGGWITLLGWFFVLLAGVIDWQPTSRTSPWSELNDDF